MDIIQKTVFISYRRTNVSWALAIQQFLSHRGYDVFFDYFSINSGSFEKIITANIKARAHFLVLLAPSALDRCDDPTDWLRREIEIAIATNRNIIPILLENFDFGAPETKKYLTGKLENLGKYNGLNIYADYFVEGMEKLCDRFLNVPLVRVPHPILKSVSSEIQQMVDEQKQAISELAQVDKNTLSAQEWFEKAYKADIPEEEIRLYTQAIELDPNFVFAYNNRGISYATLKQFERAIEDYEQAIRLYPKFAIAYNNRGNCYANLKQYERAIEDYNQTIKLNPRYPIAYNNRGNIYADLQQYELAIKDYDQAVKLNPGYADAYNSRGIAYAKQKQYERAIEEYNQALKLNAKYSVVYNNRGNSYVKLKQYDRAIEDPGYQVGTGN